MSTELAKLYFVIDITGGTDAGEVVHSYVGDSGYMYACDRANKEALANPGRVYDIAAAKTRYYG